MVAAVAPTNDTEALAIDLERALYRVAWLGQQQFAHQLTHHDLTVAQYHTLCHLLDATDDGVSMGVLARATGHTLATMTGIVDRLHARGLVERKSKPGDRRVVLIAIVPDREIDIIRAREARRHGLALAVSQLRREERTWLPQLLDLFADAMGIEAA